MSIESLHAAIQYLESIGAWQLAMVYRRILSELE